ncbi:hypothetical protein T07_11272 [Trichinella nelsoni]|uniref:EGF-like domain-containing protein n=1 Tax=Trichinella nelsoni TaxID=6336 RepID=A0A0V0RLV4_9BILA|nr:hypothetical protein T07_11272 [Trichinella nelsoni]
MPGFEVFLIFLFCFNVQKALSNSSSSCPVDTYPDVYRGGRRDEIVRLWTVNTSAYVAQFTQANFAKAVNTGLCKKNSCKNGGCCAVLSETHFRCLCAHGFKGTLCEEAVSTFEEIAITLSNSYVTMVIAICSLVAVAFLYLSGKAVRRHRVSIFYIAKLTHKFSKMNKLTSNYITISLIKLNKNISGVNK